jgi:hypothetical protein
MSKPDVFYLLRPVYECEPGWWKLRWRPIWGETFSVYRDRRWGARWWQNHGLGAHWYWSHDGHNGWGRHFHRVDVYAHLIWWRFNFWIRWNFRVMESGPMDVAKKDQQPLTIPAGARRLTKETQP